MIDTDKLQLISLKAFRFLHEFKETGQTDFYISDEYTPIYIWNKLDDSIGINSLIDISFDTLCFKFYSGHTYSPVRFLGEINIPSFLIKNPDNIFKALEHYILAVIYFIKQLDVLYEYSLYFIGTADSDTLQHICNLRFNEKSEERSERFTTAIEPPNFQYYLYFIEYSAYPLFEY